jgi:hypothetical protein
MVNQCCAPRSDRRLILDLGQPDLGWNPCVTLFFDKGLGRFAGTWFPWICIAVILLADGQGLAAFALS